MIADSSTRIAPPNPIAKAWGGHTYGNVQHLIVLGEEGEWVAALGQVPPDRFLAAAKAFLVAEHDWKPADFDYALDDVSTRWAYFTEIPSGPEDTEGWRLDWARDNTPATPAAFAVTLLSLEG